MAEFFASGHLVDLILALTVVECGCLLLYWRLKRRGIAPFDLIPNLLAGAFLLLSLRLTLQGASWQLVCVSLAAAGLSHVVDLTRRWRR